MKMLALIVLALPLLSLVGCQTMPYQPYAREVKRQPGKGGEIALKTEHRDEDRAKAQMMMGTNCGANAIKVTEEGEVVIGQTTNSNASQTHNQGQAGTTVGTFLGMPITSGGTQASNDTAMSATTTALKEWNIKYDCETAVATAAPAAPTKTKKKK
ncbi:hypothetical protein BH10BDE1_BH10BDE1_33130 [soil metagenome]